MSNILIVGIGGIGSRHLQGAAKSPLVNTIQCVDINNANIEIAAERLHEIQHNKKVSFHKTLKDINGDIDICIVATPAAPRKKIIFEILEHTNVSNFILEKVVFQSEEDFTSIIRCFAEKNISCWVNCHSRTEHRYRFIKNDLNRNFPIEIEALCPPNFNLASSMIHCLDLFCYFCDDYQIEIDASELDKEIYESKHPNCMEVKGNITARNSTGDRLTIKPGPVTAQSYNIENNNTSYFSSEDINSFVVTTAKSKKVIDSKFLWQNSLTNLYIDDIVGKNDCKLPTLEESSKIHKIMFEALREYFSIEVVNIT